MHTWILTLSSPGKAILWRCGYMRMEFCDGPFSKGVWLQCTNPVVYSGRAGEDTGISQPTIMTVRLSWLPGFEQAAEKYQSDRRYLSGT